MDLKLLSAIGAAGAAGGDVIGVEDVFKTYVYTGNGTAQGTVQQIVNGIDNTGGGLVWIKNRGQNVSHMLLDTERVDGNGDTYELKSDSSNAQAGPYSGMNITAFNNNGFKLEGNGGNTNENNKEYVSWNFKKQEKFFTICTWTGDGNTGRVISHDLGSVPGAIFIKKISGSDDWTVWHRRLNEGTNPHTKKIYLNGTDAEAASTNDFTAAPTSTGFTLGNDGRVNESSSDYVAYLFGHEEAEFGPNSDQKIISCGSYEGTGSAGLSVTLPFELQYIMIKNIDRASTGWFIFDSMRALPVGGEDFALFANAYGTETSWGVEFIDINATGFTLKTVGNDDTNKNGDTFIYIAIAAETGKTSKVPENASDVFAMDYGNGSTTIPAFDSGFPVDFGLLKRPASSTEWSATSRLQGPNYLVTNDDSAEAAGSAYVWDSNVGYTAVSWADSALLSWMWKRNAGLDCICYKGTGSARTIEHSLGSNNVPEMIWTKKRNNTGNWHVYHKGLNGGTTPQNYYINLNTSDAQTNTAIWNNQPTSSVFHLSSDGHANSNGDDFIAILFSTVSGISKCGYHTCGAGNVTLSMDFSPRFLLLKNISTGSTPWVVIDTLRGITASAGNTPTLNLSGTSQQSNYTWIQSISSSGIEINAGQGDRFSNDGDDFIWYAHA